MSVRLAAPHINTEFFFNFLKRVKADKTSNTPEQVHIDMYNTLYVLVKQDGKWQNDGKNKLKMRDGLVNAVIATLQAEGL